MKNYIEHETSVRFMDQYFNKGNDWQWFINLIEKEFELEDVSSWQGYVSMNWRYGQLYSCMERIVEVGNPQMVITKAILQDLFFVADYRVGSLTIEEAKEKIITVYGKTFLLVVWATKLEKQDGTTGLIYDNDLFELRNIWQFRALDELSMYCEDMLEYASTIRLDDVAEVISCYSDNIEGRFMPCREGFVDELSSKINRKEYFDFISERINPLSWQERIVIALIHNRIDGGKYPINNIFPKDMEREEIEKRLIQIKSYFSNAIIDFIIETVLFFTYDTEPSDSTKIEYLTIWTDVYQASKGFNKFTSVGFYGTSKIFTCKLVGNVSRVSEYRSFLAVLQEESEIWALERLAGAHFPISVEQKNILKEYRKTAYKRIDEIVDPHSFMDYLDEEVVQKSIDDSYFEKTTNMFVSLLDNIEVKRILPSFFYKFMIFLLSVKNVGTVSKKMIDVTIINIQHLWEEQYYEIVLKGMQSFSKNTQISNEDVMRFNDEVMRNPLLFAKTCMALDEDNVCAIMKRTSENPLHHMATRIEISKIYPVKNDGISLERHDVDQYLYDFVSQIEKEKGYKFLNKMDITNYMESIYEDIHLRSRFMISMFLEEEKLYHIIEKDSGIKLVPYDSSITLAHVTQLFPLLEKSVRRVSSLFGVAPFKEDVKSFMQYKDPSSLLREMIKEAYEATKSFEIIYDLMFVYCLMYNSNSMNIRNECIHGRGYDKENELRFAFRVSLLSIYMMDYRYRLVCAQGDTC